MRVTSSCDKHVTGIYAKCPTFFLLQPWHLSIYPLSCSRHSDCNATLSCINRRCLDPCSSPENQCGPRALCDVTAHIPTCTCPEGHVGDPLNMEVGCVRVECSHPSHCAYDRTCDPDTNRCISKYRLLLCSWIVFYLLPYYFIHLNAFNLQHIISSSKIISLSAAVYQLCINVYYY